MSKPFNTSFDETRSPISSPHIGTPAAPLLAPAFKTNIHRAKSKRWVEAKAVDYGGGWGDDDDFDDDDDPYADDGYGPSYGAKSPPRGNGGSYDKRDDAPSVSAGPKLSELGRPNGSVVPRIETHAPAGGIPLPPTPLELEQREQASRQNSLGGYFKPAPQQQQSQGGILQSFLPQIITSRSSSPARPIVRTPTMGFDKPLPPPAPQSPKSPPPPPAKEKIPPPLGYSASPTPKAPSSPGKDFVPPPLGMGYRVSPSTSTTSTPRFGSPSVAESSLGSLGRPMLPPKDTHEDKPLPSWHNSPSIGAALPSPPSPSPPPPPVISKNEPEFTERPQPEVRFASPASIAQFAPPPPAPSSPSPPPAVSKDEPKRVEKEQPALPYVSPPSIEQYIPPTLVSPSPPPPPPPVISKNKPEPVEEGQPSLPYVSSPKVEQYIPPAPVSATPSSSPPVISKSEPEHVEKEQPSSFFVSHPEAEQYTAPAPVPPSLPPPVISKSEPERVEKEQPSLYYTPPSKVEQYTPPAPSSPLPPIISRNEPERTEIEQPPYVPPPSARQYTSSPPPPPPPPPPPQQIRRVETAPERSRWDSPPQMPVSQNNAAFPPPMSGGSGKEIDYDDGYYGYQQEEIRHRPDNFQDSQTYHPPPQRAYRSNEYVGEEYYQAPNYQQHQVRHPPPQQSYGSSFAPQYQPPMPSHQPASPGSPFRSNSSPPPPPALSSPSQPILSTPSPPSSPGSGKRLIRPSDIYARMAEEREKERFASEETSKLAARASVDFQAGGVSIANSGGHLSPDLSPQPRVRNSISSLGESTGNRPESRQGDNTKSSGRRHSRSGSHSHSRSSSRAESRNGSRPVSRQDLVARSPSPYPPPTGALPPVPLPVVPASPDSPKYEAKIDQLFAEHERRQQQEKLQEEERQREEEERQREEGSESWNDDIIAGYGGSAEEVENTPQQYSVPSQGQNGRGPTVQTHILGEGQHVGFKSMVNNAFTMQDALPTPISPSEDTLALPGVSRADAISPILSQGRFGAITRSDTLPNVSSAQMAPMQPLERSRTERLVRDETSTIPSPRSSIGAERSARTVIPRLDTGGSHGEIAEITADTPGVNQRLSVSTSVSHVEGEDGGVYIGVEREGAEESEDRSPEKDYLETFLGELEGVETPVEDNLPRKRQLYDSSSLEVGAVQTPQFHGQSEEPRQKQPQQPFDPSSFGVVGSGGAVQYSRQEGDLHQQPQHGQRPFDPSSFGVIDSAGPSQLQHAGLQEQKQYQQGQEQQQTPFDPSSFGVVRSADSPQYQPRSDKQLPQQPQYEQEHQQSHYEQQQQALGNSAPALYSDAESNRDSVAVFNLYDSYWTQEAAPPSPPPPPTPPPPPPPPPPVKNPRRPSASDLAMLVHSSSPLPEPPSQSLQGRNVPPPVTIPDRVAPLDRSEMTPASALETPDSEFMEMMIARRQFLARTQTGLSATGEIEKSKEKERVGGEGRQEGGVLETIGEPVVPEQSHDGVQNKRESLQTPTGPQSDGLRIIPSSRVIGPESEGMEVITGPTKVIREESPTKEGEEDGEKTPMQSEFARELVNQFSRPQTLMLKDTMPMPSGLLVMPPMPPKEAGEEDVPEVVDFSVKDEDTDDEGAKHSQSTSKPNKHASGRPSSLRAEAGKPMQYMEIQEITQLRSSEARVAAYNQARKAIGETQTGLGNWVRYMMEENKGAELLQYTPEPKLRPESSGGRRQHNFLPTVGRVEDSVRPGGPGMSPVLQQQQQQQHQHQQQQLQQQQLQQQQQQQGGMPRLSNGNAQRPAQGTPTPSVATGGSGISNTAHNIVHAPAVEKTVDKARGFFGKFGKKAGKEGKESYDQQQPQQQKRSASNMPPTPQSPAMSSHSPLIPTGFQNQGYGAPVAQPQLVQGQMQGQMQVQGQQPSFHAPMGHHQQYQQSHQEPHQGPYQGSMPPQGLQHGQQVPVQVQRPQYDVPLQQDRVGQNDLGQLVQRGQMIQQAQQAQQTQQVQQVQQAQLTPLPQTAQQLRQPPMTLGDPSQPHSRSSSRPRSQPQPPQLIIPDQSQQRSVSATGPTPQQDPVNPISSHQPAGGLGLQIQPPPESARSSPHSHLSQDKSERSSPTPPPVATAARSPSQQAQQFPKRSDSLYSRSRFKDSRTASPTAQRPDRSDSLSSSREQQQRDTRSDSLSSMREQQQRAARSDSLSRQQQTQHIPTRADSLASTVLSDGFVSPVSAHPHNVSGGFESVNPPPQETRYAGERRGQNAFAPREEPEQPQQPRQLQQAPASMVRSASEQPPPHVQVAPQPGIIRSQTGYVGPHPESYQGNEQQQIFIPEQQKLRGPPQPTPQGPSVNYNDGDDDLYSPPPPKIQMQQPSPPRGPLGPGQQFSHPQYQQGGQLPQMGSRHPGNFPPQGPVGGSPDPRQQQSEDPRQYFGPGGPGQNPSQITSLSQQTAPQGAYQRQFSPGDPRAQYQASPQHQGHQKQQGHPGQPSYQGPPGMQPTSYGPSQGPPEPGIRRTPSGLMKTLSGVSAHSGSTQYATSTTSSQEKRRSNFFANLSTKVGDVGKDSSQITSSSRQSQDTIEPRMVKDTGRRTSFMNRGKKDKDGLKEKKEKGEKPGKASHKKGFSIDVFGRAGSVIGKLTKSPSPTPSTQYQPPSQPPSQQFQPGQVQPHRVSSEMSQRIGQQQPRPQNQSAFVENMNTVHESQHPPLGGLQGRGSSPIASPGAQPPGKQLPQVPSHHQPPGQQFPAHQFPATQKPQHPQQSQPQYEPVPIPAGYGRLQGEYHATPGQHSYHPPPQPQPQPQLQPQPQQQQQQQQLLGHRRDFSNANSSVSGRASIDIQPSIDRHDVSPDLSRQGTQASRTHETTRSLSPPLSDGPPRSMSPSSEAGQFGRQQSLREGSLLGHQTPPIHLSPKPSLREERGHENQRYQQPLPLPQSIAEVQNGANEHERAPSPRSMPLPVSPPLAHPPFSPPIVQMISEPPANIIMDETMPRAKTPSPPTPPPKVEIERPMEDESKQKGKEIASPYNSGNFTQSIDAANSRVASSTSPPSGPASSPPPAAEKLETPTSSPRRKQKEADTEKEAVDFSTEKIAVNLDLYGPSTKKGDGEDSEEEYIMSSTAYPGQAWEPSYYGWS